MGTEQKHPKVSVIIPVYNTAAYLGYCLNSVVSQTWSDLEAVIVNDGSTDDSLEICQRFAALDPRFHIISIPNSGVSSARNTAIAAAKGDYFLFLDSDDYLAFDALEQMLRAEGVYHTGLVIGDVQLVDLSTGEILPTRLCADYTGEKFLFSKEEFASRKMELIWHTSLLEGVYGKFIDARIWREAGIHFPEGMSLGEDFVANMNYYNACNGVVFLKRTTYYYNTIVKSNSLTHKYRADLFDNKMLLMEKLLSNLGELETLRPYERRCFCEYVASTGLRCMEEVRKENVHLAEEDKLSALRHMLDHELFQRCVVEAEYVDDRFCAWLPLVKAKDAERLLNFSEVGETTPAQVATPSVPQIQRRFLNRTIGKAARIAAGMCGNHPLRGRLLQFDQNLCAVGLKNTFRQYSRKERRENAVLSDQRAMVQSLLENERNEQIWRLEAVRVDIQGSLWMIKEQQEALAKAQAANLEVIKEQQEAQAKAQEEHQKALAKVHEADLASLQHMILGVQTALQESQALVRTSALEVRNQVYLGECRTEEGLQRYRINELRQKKKVLMIGTSEHSNIGDAAITLAEQYLLQKLYPDYFQMEFSTYELERQYTFLQAIMNPEDILFIQGGGNLGSLYQAEEDLHRLIITDFPNHQVVILPQTIYFSNDEHGCMELAQSEQVYNHHPDLTIFTRGKESCAFAAEHFAHARVHLMPDTALALRRSYPFKREGVLLCLREDKEGIYNEEQRALILTSVSELGHSVDKVSNMAADDIPREKRAGVVNSHLKCFARHRVVVTDRLHGVIFSAITGTPCVSLGMGNQKILEFIDTFFRDSNAVFYIGSDLDRLQGAVQKALEVEKPVFPILDSQPLDKIRHIVECRY